MKIPKLIPTALAIVAAGALLALFGGSPRRALAQQTPPQPSGFSAIPVNGYTGCFDAGTATLQCVPQSLTDGVVLSPNSAYRVCVEAASPLCGLQDGGVLRAYTYSAAQAFEMGQLNDGGPPCVACGWVREPTLDALFPGMVTGGTYLATTPLVPGACVVEHASTNPTDLPKAARLFFQPQFVQPTNDAGGYAAGLTPGDGGACPTPNVVVDVEAMSPQ